MRLILSSLRVLIVLTAVAASPLPAWADDDSLFNDSSGGSSDSSGSTPIFYDPGMDSSTSSSGSSSAAAPAIDYGPAAATPQTDADANKPKDAAEQMQQMNQQMQAQDNAAAAKREQALTQDAHQRDAAFESQLQDKYGAVTSNGATSGSGPSNTVQVQSQQPDGQVTTTIYHKAYENAGGDIPRRVFNIQ